MFCRLFIVIGLAGWCLKVLAMLPDPVPDPKLWSEKYLASQPQNNLFPTTLLMLQKYGGSPLVVKPLEFDSSICRIISFMTCANGVNFSFAMKLNKMSDKMTLDDLMKLSLSNSILFDNGSKVILEVKGQAPVDLPTIKAMSSNLSVQNILNGVFAALGFDGIVLAIKGDFILVGTLQDKIDKDGLQGLLIRGSAQSMVLKPADNKDGTALVSLIARYGGFAVFKKDLESSGSTVEIGQKLVLESKNERSY